MKTRRKNLRRKFLEEYFLPGTNLSFMVIVIHLEGLDIELQNVACMFEINIIPGYPSKMDIPKLNIISINLII